MPTLQFVSMIFNIQQRIVTIIEVDITFNFYDGNYSLLNIKC